MVKLKGIKKKSKEVILNEFDKAKMFDLAFNESITRSTLLNKLIDPRRDIDDECGYPKNITNTQYKIMYDREGIATRIVSIFPQESWAEDPKIMEDDKPEDTEFEEAWKILEREKQLFSYMARIDELSGIGSYGILLLGLSDGEDLSKPVDGIDEKGQSTNKVGKYELMYLRAFDESSVSIKESEKDMTNPRYGMPVMYSLKFEDATATDITEDTGKELKVHWTRVIHIADNRKSSEVFGVPRMQTLFNRLYDLRKITGGSAEVFWRGGFPGCAFGVGPGARAMTTAEKTTLRTTVADFSNGLQRYIRLQGIKVNSLTPQVADPKAHIEVQLEIIAIAMGIPKRIFMGAEQAKLASINDTDSWNKRVKRRQNKYITPYIVRTVIDRLIAFGVLPEPVQYDVEWEDLSAPSELDKASVLKAYMEALSKYVGGNVDQLIPPEVLLKMFMGMDEDEIKNIMEQAKERQDEFDEEQAELDIAASEEEAIRLKEEEDRIIRAEDRNRE